MPSPVDGRFAGRAVYTEVASLAVREGNCCSYWCEGWSEGLEWTGTHGGGLEWDWSGQAHKRLGLERLE